MKEMLLVAFCLLLSAGAIHLFAAGWVKCRAIMINAAMSFVVTLDEEMLPRSVVLWYAREDQKVCRFLGEDIQSRYLIARENARYL